MGYSAAHAPIYGYLKGHKHTIPLQLIHYARTYSLFKLFNRIKIGSVLNVGGADGYQSYLIKQLLNVDVTTLDINSFALEIAEKRYGVKTQVGSALDIPFADNSFDTVICIETIEHIKDSQTVINELRRVAKKNVIISTESFFDSEEQKHDFLLYIRETHPQFFKAENPAQLSDVAYFTIEDFKHFFDQEALSFYPQFSQKQADILGPIDDIRSHIKHMTESLPINKRTKVIVHYCKGEIELNENPLNEDILLDTIVSDEPLFPLEIDEEMAREDAEYITRLQEYHAAEFQSQIVDSRLCPSLPIEEEETNGMSLQWLTPDNNERSPSFCTRKVCLEISGFTPPRKTAWENQIFILSGEGVLVEDSRETPLQSETMVHIRPNIPFRIKNTGDSELRYLHMIPSITRFFGR